MSRLSPETIARFRHAVAELDLQFVGDRLDDGNTEFELRKWLDGHEEPMLWSHLDRVTADEWFFITTLYGTMSLRGQRTHIRKYFPRLFVQAAKRDIRNFVPGMAEYAGLRQAWMAPRLYNMGRLLRERACTMTEYVEHLRQVEQMATPDDPMPALDRIIGDHGAAGWKTLSVFVRDCVGGNSFPIDSRVEKTLKRHQLPVDERQLVRAYPARHES